MYKRQVQEGSRSIILQDIICERRCPENPPTVDKRQERWRADKFSPNKPVSYTHLDVYKRQIKDTTAKSSSESRRQRKEAFYLKIRDYVSKQVCVPMSNAFMLKEWRLDPSHVMINLDCFQIKNIIRDIEQE